MFYVGGAVGMRNVGAYAAGTTYFPNDIVQYNGSSYIATAVSAGNLPTNTSYWQTLASAAAAAYPRSTAGPTVTAQTSRAQANLYTLSAYATTAAAWTLTTDGSATVTATNVPVIPMFSTWEFQLTISGRRLGVIGASQGWMYSGMLVRDNGGNARLVGSLTQLAAWSDSAIATVAVTANTTGQYLQITVTPAVAPTLWNAVLEVNELTTTT